MDPARAGQADRNNPPVGPMCAAACCQFKHRFLPPSKRGNEQQVPPLRRKQRLTVRERLDATRVVSAVPPRGRTHASTFSGGPPLQPNTG